MNIDVKKNRDLINQLIKDNDVDDETVKFYSQDIQWFLDHHFECKYEDDLEKNCHQTQKGYMDELEYENGRFYRVLRPCAHTNYQNDKKAYLNRFLFTDFDPLEYDSPFGSKYFPNTKIRENIDVFISPNADPLKVEKQLGMSKQEFELKQMICKFFVKQLNSNKPLGIYLYGAMGVGKTTLLRLMATYAAINLKTIAFSNVANLANKIKESFNTNSDTEIISKLQNADVLFLDDIGGESATEWLRDDVLYNILNFRMANHKLTFFTSNLSLRELTKHYDIKGRSPKTLVTKDERLMERINVLAKEMELPGPDHRIKN